MNLELANKVLNQITAHPESHYQGTWIYDNETGNAETLGESMCGTQACVAGWAVALSDNVIQVNVGGDFGRRYINGEYQLTFFTKDWVEHREEYLDMMREAGESYRDELTYNVNHPECGSSDWTLVAARLLDIPLAVADDLFRGSNTEAQARELLRDLIDTATREEKRKAEAGELSDATD